MTGQFGIDFTTAYYFRGILQENQDFISQPHLELDYHLHQGDDTLQNVDLALGQWNSLHAGETGSGGSNQSMWYESDFYASLRAGLLQRVQASTTYTAYYSPNGRFGTVQELAFGLAFDDSGLLGSFPALHPSALLAFETGGQADGGSKRGIYAQLGIAPAFALGEIGIFDFTVTPSATVGLSTGHYYEDPSGHDSRFGYLDLGGALSSPLKFLPARLGPWDAAFSLHGLFLGDSTEAVNSGRSFVLIGALGFSTTF